MGASREGRTGGASHRRAQSPAQLDLRHGGKRSFSRAEAVPAHVQEAHAFIVTPTLGVEVEVVATLVVRTRLRSYGDHPGASVFVQEFRHEIRLALIVWAATSTGRNQATDARDAAGVSNPQSRTKCLNTNASPPLAATTVGVAPV